MSDTTRFDAIIIGGSYAGLSAAMSLGRSMKRVLVIDGGSPCNESTPASHNFLTHDGTPPAEISALARRQVERYDTVRFIDTLADHAERIDGGFRVVTQAGEYHDGKKLLLATGLNDRLPEIPGIAECWGITAIHCPYCHGYEFRSRPTAILADGDKAFHLSTLIRGLTDDLVLVTNGPTTLTEEQIATLREHRIAVIDTPLASVEQERGVIRRLHFVDATTRELDALYLGLPIEQRSRIPAQLGCELTEAGHLVVDPMQKTTVEGVFACGDNSSMVRSVANAVGTGSIAGAMINMELSKERF